VNDAAPRPAMPGALIAVLHELGNLRADQVARIHGTVDLERALRELGRSTGEAATAVEEPLIGARVVVIDEPGGGTVALAEPTTEGRLAASLARHGEGHVGDYVALGEQGQLDHLRAAAARAGIRLSSVAVGPFGPGVLVLDGRIWDRQLIVVEPRSLPSAR
jgi:hypothetical protein